MNDSAFGGSGGIDVVVDDDDMGCFVRVYVPFAVIYFWLKFNGFQMTERIMSPIYVSVSISICLRSLCVRLEEEKKYVAWIRFD